MNKRLLLAFVMCVSARSLATDSKDHVLVYREVEVGDLQTVPSATTSSVNDAIAAAVIADNLNNASSVASEPTSASTNSVTSVVPVIAAQPTNDVSSVNAPTSPVINAPVVPLDTTTISSVAPVNPVETAATNAPALPFDANNVAQELPAATNDVPAVDTVNTQEITSAVNTVDNSTVDAFEITPASQDDTTAPADVDNLSNDTSDVTTPDVASNDNSDSTDSDTTTDSTSDDSTNDDSTNDDTSSDDSANDDSQDNVLNLEDIIKQAWESTSVLSINDLSDNDKAIARMAADLILNNDGDVTNLFESLTGALSTALAYADQPADVASLIVVSFRDSLQAAKGDLEKTNELFQARLEAIQDAAAAYFGR